jgi:predicted ATPase
MPISSWTLDVTGLGPIKQAEIEVRPLTLLVGENSTGKSYLATLLWGLAQTHRVNPGLIPAANEPMYGQIDQWMETSSYQFSLSNESLRRFFELANPMLARMKRQFVAKLFNSALVAADNIRLRSALGQSDSDPQIISLIERAAVHPREYLHRLRFSLMLNHALGLGGDFTAKYLPASRTGFMLTYESVVRQSLDSSFSESDADDTPAATARARLTRPTIEFLKLLATGADERSGFVAEAQALEDALGGEIVKHSRAGFNQYEYRMKGASVALPMSIVSTVVSELAPIVLVLKHSDKLPFLVIEEPEAHLHPKVQRMLAVVIARLIRKGVRVVLTTHGDLFCHQLNNLVKLGALPVAKRRALQRKFKLKETDYLLPDEVSGYGLMLSKDRTHSVVSALQMTPYGLEMPTFNAEIDSLEAQTEALDTAIEAGQ